MNKERVARNYALANAVKYEGKASAGNIVGAILQNYPDWKGEIKSLMPLIQKAVGEVNKLTIAEQVAEIEEHAPELLEKKRTDRPKDELKPLPNGDFGKVVMRVEPSPSGYLHLGHSFPLILNSEYCRQYGGKMILRISDTNPEKIVSEAYEYHYEDAQWLTQGNVAKMEIQSERMEIYYAHMLELVEKGHAYVCNCSSEDFKKLADTKTACPCRGKAVKQNVTEWHGMLTDTPEGDAVVRMKTDIAHKNPAMRDFPLFRIDENEHARQGKKYRAWPLMNFAVAIDDHDMGMTHVIRGKDHLDNTQRQMYLYNSFGWTPPEFIHTGLVSIHGLPLSKTEIKQKIAEGYYTGWEDPRIAFLRIMRRRGYRPEALTKMVKSYGVTAVDKSVEASEFFKTLNFYNKEVVDPIAKRYYFVENPKEVIVTGAPMREVELDLHPSNIKGGRDFACGEKFLLADADLKEIKKDELVRLHENLNFKKTPKGYSFVSTAVDDWKGKGDKILHWIPSTHAHVPVRLIMDDGTIRLGAGESRLGELEPLTTVQFERMCFATYQGLVDGAHEFWYLHR